MPLSRAILTIVVLVAAASYSRPDAQALRTVPAPSIQPCLPKCAGATSAHIAPAAPSPPRGIPASRTPSISASVTAASGRPPMRGVPGRRSSTVSRPARSDRSWSRRPIRTCSTSAAAKGSAAPGPVGRRRDLQIDRRRPDVDPSGSARRSADSKYRRRSAETPTGCSSRSPATHTDPTRSEASSDRPMAARSFEKVLFKDVNTGGNDVDIDPVESRHRLRDALGGASGTVGERAMARHGRRHLQVDRRRLDVEAVDERTAAERRRHAGQHRDRAERFEAARTRRSRSTPRRRFYRSDDAGETWTQITQDTRPVGRIGGGDLAGADRQPEECRHA